MPPGVKIGHVRARVTDPERVEPGRGVRQGSLKTPQELEHPISVSLTADKTISQDSPIFSKDYTPQPRLLAQDLIGPQGETSALKLFRQPAKKASLELSRQEPVPEIRSQQVILDRQDLILGIGLLGTLIGGSVLAHYLGSMAQQVFALSFPLMGMSWFGRGKGGEVDPKIVDRVKEEVRDKLMDEIQDRGFFRNSPTAGIPNFVFKNFEFDFENGNINEISKDHSHGLQVVADVKNQRILIHPNYLQWVEGILRRKDLSIKQRSVLRAVQELNGETLIPSNQLFLPMTEGYPYRGQEWMAQISSIKLERLNNLISAKDPRDNISLTATFGASSLAMSVLPHEFLDGIITLDAHGNAIGGSFSRPLLTSARGTTYERNVLVGTRVRVVVDMKGTLYHFEKIEEGQMLNFAQEALMLAYLNSPENMAKVREVKKTNPFLVDLVFGREMAFVLDSLNNALADAKSYKRAKPVKIHLIDTDQGYRFIDPKRMTRDQKKHFIASFKMNYVRRHQEGLPSGIFSYELIKGTLPHGIEKFLEHVRQRVEREKEF